MRACNPVTGSFWKHGEKSEPQKFDAMLNGVRVLTI